MFSAGRTAIVLDDVERSQSTALEGGARKGDYGSTQQREERESLINDKNASVQGTSPALLRMAETRPFPLREVAILALCMIMNMYALVNLLPYVGVMVKALLGLKTTNEVGFYAGYVASSFTFGRFLSSYIWGSITDRFGRKPVIVIGLLSMTTFSLVFGMSTTYTMAIVSRLVLGLTNGIMAALRITASEVLGPEHVVQGMTYLSASRSISMVMGTGIGGILSQPAIHHPNMFSATGLFGRFPFLLPNLVGAVMSVITLILVVVFLPETKGFDKERRVARHALLMASTYPGESPGNSPDRSGSNICRTMVSPTKPSIAPGDSAKNDYDHQQRKLLNGVDIYRLEEEGGGKPSYQRRSLDVLVAAPLDAASSSPSDAERSSADRDSSIGRTDELSGSEEEDEEHGLLGPGGLLATRHVKMILFLACIISTISIGFDEVYPLYALSTPDVGGLGWNVEQIGQVLVATGMLMAVCQVVLFPPFIQMVGIMTWQRLGCGVGVATFVAVPAAKTLAWDYNSIFAMSAVVNAIACSGLGAVTLALTIGSTTLVSSSMRGKLGGLYNMSESFGRFLGPAGYAVTYAWSVSPSTLDAYGGWVDCRFVFYASAAALALVAVLAWRTLTVDNLMAKKVEEVDTGGGLSNKHVSSSSPSQSALERGEGGSGAGRGKQ